MLSFYSIGHMNTRTNGTGEFAAAVAAFGNRRKMNEYGISRHKMIIA